MRNLNYLPSEINKKDRDIRRRHSGYSGSLANRNRAIFFLVLPVLIGKLPFAIGILLSPYLQYLKYSESLDKPMNLIEFHDSFDQT